MPAPILATKLYVPRSRPKVVHRPRLLAQLDEGLERKLIVISAPAGFGKTTLTSQWLDTLHSNAGAQEAAKPQRARVAWLSLEPADADLTRFLSYLVAALQTVAPDIGQGVASALQMPQPPPVETMLTALLNEVAAQTEEMVLVLDDYHVIDAQAVDQVVTFMLDHMPPQLHLLMTTREDPDLPLARLRVRAQLTELRAADLRFSPAEAADFFSTVMGLTLTPAEIAVLEARTEGWIAGLQLAALSMRGRDDIQGFITAFAGENRYVVDYLVEEVLQRQPDSVRTFLLHTSILEQLTGPLCDAVTGQTDGGAMLDGLERNNLFVIPLDDARHWYRYHHLFADVLQAHLEDEDAQLIPILHRRACDWFAAHGEPMTAVRHALAAADYPRAAELLELAWRAMDQALQSRPWLAQARALPDALVRTRPVLSVGIAWALLNDGLMEEGMAQLDAAEQVLATAATAAEKPDDTGALVVVDEAEYRALPGSIASARAYYAQAMGDEPAALGYARQALALIPPENHVGRAIPNAIVGLGHWAQGDLDAAHTMLRAAMTDFQAAGNDIAELSVTYGLADILTVQGRLHDARATYLRALPIAQAHGEPAPRGTAEIYLGLAELSREQGDLDTAAQQLAQSEALGEQAALPDWTYRVRVAQARMHEIQGDFAGALTLLDEAEARYFRTPVPLVRPFAAQRARILLRQGRLDAAQAWVQETGLAVDDALSFLREFEHVTLARVLLATNRQTSEPHAGEQALLLLERLLHAAQAGGRNGSAIEILVLRALTHDALGARPHAVAVLAQALTQAAPEGYVRVFVDEGAPMATLLRAVQADSSSAYVRRLLAAFTPHEDAPTGEQPEVSARQPVEQPLVEPLSERELTVLRLLTTELTGPEIARELVVSLNTMRTHTKNIYSKLGVSSRRAAVRRAQELNLI